MPRTSDEVIARVNGAAITRAMYDEYALIFVDPEGALAAEPRDLVLSLVNQAIAHEEATRRGLTVDKALVEDSLAEVANLDVHGSQLDRAGGRDALRSRIRAFIEMDAVKRAVLAEPASAPQGTPIPGDRTGSLERERVWSAWLAARRSCAEITVYDPSLQISSSTLAPTCLRPAPSADE